MRCLPLAPRCTVTVVALALVAITGAEARAIEMFTFYGDGSRVGLPSLEVPIEAYPGIPLRSDRLRARRRGMRAGPQAAMPRAPRGPSQTITIRAMPQEMAPASPQPSAPRHTKPQRPMAVEEVPMPPEPDTAPIPPMPRQ